jgi:hypothetical protein
MPLMAPMIGYRISGPNRSSLLLAKRAGTSTRSARSVGGRDAPAPLPEVDAGAERGMRVLLVSTTAPRVDPRRLPTAPHSARPRARSRRCVLATGRLRVMVATAPSCRRG